MNGGEVAEEDLVFLVLQGLNTIITVELDRFRLFIEHCNYIGNELINMV